MTTTHSNVNLQGHEDVGRLNVTEKGLVWIARHDCSVALGWSAVAKYDCHKHENKLTIICKDGKTLGFAMERDDDCVRVKQEIEDHLQKHHKKSGAVGYPKIQAPEEIHELLPSSNASYASRSAKKERRPPPTPGLSAVPAADEEPPLIEAVLVNTGGAIDHGGPLYYVEQQQELQEPPVLISPEPANKGWGLKLETNRSKWLCFGIVVACLVAVVTITAIVLPGNSDTNGSNPIDIPSSTTGAPQSTPLNIFGGPLGFVTEELALRNCPNLWNSGFDSFVGCLGKFCHVFHYEEECGAPGNVPKSTELPDCDSIGPFVMNTYGKPGCCIAYCIGKIIELSKCIRTMTSPDHDCGVVDGPPLGLLPMTIEPLNFYFAIGDYYRFNDRMAWDFCSRTREAFMSCAAQACLNYETLCPNLGSTAELDELPECDSVRDLLVRSYGQTEGCCLIDTCLDELESMSKCILFMVEFLDCGNYDTPP